MRWGNSTPAANARLATEQARIYHAAALRCFPGIIPAAVLANYRRACMNASSLTFRRIAQSRACRRAQSP